MSTAPTTSTEEPGARDGIRARGVAQEDLDRAIGLVMSPQTWLAVRGHPFASEPAEGERLFRRLPVWLQLDCEGVQVVGAGEAPEEARDEVVWI